MQRNRYVIVKPISFTRSCEKGQVEEGTLSSPETSVGADQCSVPRAYGSEQNDMFKRFGPSDIHARGADLTSHSKIPVSHRCRRSLPFRTFPVRA